MTEKKCFRISVHLGNFYHDHRSFARIFINDKMKTISDLKKHVINIFDVKNFDLVCQNQFLPESEDIRILDRDDLIILVPEVKTPSVITSINIDALYNSEQSITKNETKTKKQKKRKTEQVEEYVDENMEKKKKHKKRKKKHISEWNDLENCYFDPASNSSLVVDENQSKNDKRNDLYEKINYFEHLQTSSLEGSMVKLTNDDVIAHKSVNGSFKENLTKVLQNESKRIVRLSNAECIKDNEMEISNETESKQDNSVVKNYTQMNSTKNITNLQGLENEIATDKLQSECINDNQIEILNATQTNSTKKQSKCIKDNQMDISNGTQTNSTKKQVKYNQMEISNGTITNSSKKQKPQANSTDDSLVNTNSQISETNSTGKQFVKVDIHDSVNNLVDKRKSDMALFDSKKDYSLENLRKSIQPISILPKKNHLVYPIITYKTPDKLENRFDNANDNCNDDNTCYNEKEVNTNVFKMSNNNGNCKNITDNINVSASNGNVMQIINTKEVSNINDNIARNVLDDKQIKVIATKEDSSLNIVRNCSNIDDKLQVICTQQVSSLNDNVASNIDDKPQVISIQQVTSLNKTNTSNIDDKLQVSANNISHSNDNIHTNGSIINDKLEIISTKEVSKMNDSITKNLLNDKQVKVLDTKYITNIDHFSALNQNNLDCVETENNINKPNEAINLSNSSQDSNDSNPQKSKQQKLEDISSTRRKNMIKFGMGQTIELIKNESDSTLDTVSDFVTKRKRRRVRTRKSKSNKSLTRAEIQDVVVVPFKPPNTTTKPRQHIIFNDDATNIDSGYIDLDNDLNVAVVITDSESCMDNNTIDLSTTADFMQLDCKKTSTVNSEVLCTTISEDAISKCPLMDRMEPKKNDILVFKILKLGEAYNPEFSSYITAKVIAFNRNSKQIDLCIVDGKDEFTVPDGKFSLINDDKIDVENENSDCLQTLTWNELIQPRLLYP